MKRKPPEKTELKAPGASQSADILHDLFIAHREELIAHARKKVGAGPPEPEAIVQQAFAKLAGSTPQALQAIENPRAFLYKSVNRLMVDYFRRATNKFGVSMEDPGIQKKLPNYDEITPEIVLLNRELLERVMDTIRALPQRQRRFLLLNRIELMSYTEIAKRNGVSISTALRETEAAVDAIRIAAKDLLEKNGKFTSR